MKWNRIKLLKAGRANGFEGKTAEQFADFVDENLMEFEGLDTRSDIIKAFNKTVTITADAGEDVVVTEQAPAELAEDGEDAEIKMEDELDPEQAKAFRQFRQFQKQGMAALQNGSPNPAARQYSTGTKKIGDRNSAIKKAYDNAVNTGQRIAVKDHGRVTPLFLSADRCEYFGASARLLAAKSEGYTQRANDERIVASFKGTTSNSASYGALVIAEELPELIENFDTYGAFERAVGGAEPMLNGEKRVRKLTEDIPVYKTAEGLAATQGEAKVARVNLIAQKLSALAVESMEIFEDSAINIGELIARSAKRSMDKYIDTSAVLGGNNDTGILSILVAGGSNVHDTASGGWSAITNADIQDTKAKAPGWVYQDPNCGWMCSYAFATSVFNRIGLDAGGNKGRDVFEGFGDLLFFDGFPIYPCEVMPRSYGSGNDIPLLFGAFSHSCKLGKVTGSEQMRSTSDRYFDTDEIGFRYDTRVAHSIHGVSATAGESGIVGLQD